MPKQEATPAFRLFMARARRRFEHQKFYRYYYAIGTHPDGSRTLHRFRGHKLRDEFVAKDPKELFAIRATEAYRIVFTRGTDWKTSCLRVWV
jgi:hypothetical protein